MNNEEKLNKKLIVFLRNIADSIEKNELEYTKLRSVGEFYMKYKFQEKSENADLSEIETSTQSEDEIVKFLVLGWYIYNHIDNNANNDMNNYKNIQSDNYLYKNVDKYEKYEK